MNAQRKSIVWARSPGLTLLELLVVLALVGLAFLLAAPSFLSAGRDPADAVQRVIDAARRTAVRRAGAITLTFEPDGRWAVEGGSQLDSLELISGTLAWPHASSVRLHISPLGACMLDSAQGPESAITIDAVRCQLREQ